MRTLYLPNQLGSDAQEDSSFRSRPWHRKCSLAESLVLINILHCIFVPFIFHHDILHVQKHNRKPQQAEVRRLQESRRKAV